jgi:signal transduction histidine kinase
VAEQFESYEGGLEIVTPADDEEIYLDKLRVRLLITNLLNNGMRHGEEKSILIRVSFNDGCGILEVIDHGEGISEKHLSQISEPFYRADSSRQRNTGGFGLGLYLCRLIAEAHGGNLLIKSTLGEGTHLTVNLPRHPPRSKAE